MNLLRFDLNSVSGATYMTRDMYRPSAVHSTVLGRMDTGPQVRLAIQESMDLSRDSLLSPSFLPGQPRLTSSSRRLDLAPQITSKTSIFGRGMLLSRAGENIVVTLVNEAANGVFQNVFASVLNGAKLLDIESPTDEEEYYFIREELRYGNDLEELERLSGSFNVSKGSLRGGGREVCVHGSNPVFTVCTLYGANVDRVTRHKIRQGHRIALKAAWRQEVGRVSMGFHGDWTPSERDELLKNGEVRGYSGEEIHSVHKFPALIGQSSNLRLVREGESSPSKESYL